MQQDIKQSIEKKGKPSKKELKLLKRLEQFEKEKELKKQNLITWLAVSLVGLLFVGLFVFIKANKNKLQTSTSNIIQSQGTVKGASDAKLDLVEFSDFQCPACKAYQPIVEKILQEFEGKIKFTYKHFPLTTIHSNATIAAKAAEAAGFQNKFWEMHDLLFAKQDEWSNVSDPIKMFINYAKDIKIDPEKFEKDINSPKAAQAVIENSNEAISRGVRATPTFYLNGRSIPTPQDYPSFKSLLEEKLAQ